MATALRGYKELNLRALKMLRPGGVLVTCSCSFHVSEAEFLEMLGSAAADAGRRVRILEKRGQSQDHPVLLNMPETAYLKCIIVECNKLKINSLSNIGRPSLSQIDNKTLIFYDSFTLITASN